MTVTSRTDGVVGHPDRHDADDSGAQGWWREAASLDRSGSPDVWGPASRPSHNALTSQLYDQGSADPYDQGLDAVPAGLAEVDETEPADPSDAQAAGDGYEPMRAELYEAAPGYEALAEFRRIPAPDPCDPTAGRMNAASTQFRAGVAGAGRARRRMVSKIPVRRSDTAPRPVHGDGAESARGIPAAGPPIPPVPGAAVAHRIERAALIHPDAATTKGRRVGSSHLPLHLRQRRARLSVFVVLAVTAGLTVLALLTARTPAAPVTSSVPTTPVSVATSARVGVGTAGLAPSIEPPPVPAQVGTTLAPGASAARAATP